MLARAGGVQACPCRWAGGAGGGRAYLQEGVVDGCSRAEQVREEFPVTTLKRASGAPAAGGIQVMLEGAVAHGGGVTLNIAVLLVAPGMAVGWACKRTCNFEAPEPKIRSRAARRLSVSLVKM